MSERMSVDESCHLIVGLMPSFLLETSILSETGIYATPENKLKQYKTFYLGCWISWRKVLTFKW